MSLEFKIQLAVSFRVNVGRKNPGMFQVRVMMFMPELVVNGPTGHAFLVWRVAF
ncbi:hypothetical protein NTGZN8_300074 [Candidatus Nitrotoga fabula]|uniref:Uncharacterized protein n=1 Tax=Candidatus Nitrotoga fabula TaxID=2182327 RepID=A0A916FAK9_9PROT|nr:hypothetical protein NTGZN8_300074 [Candidatus Nitrotoga fabula]